MMIPGKKSWVILLLSIAAGGCTSPRRVMHEEDLFFKPLQPSEVSERRARPKAALTDAEGERMRSELVRMASVIDSLKRENAALVSKASAPEGQNRGLAGKVAELQAKRLTSETSQGSPGIILSSEPPLGSRPNAQPPLKLERTGSFRREYEESLDLFRQRKYKASIEAFEALIKNGIPPDLVGNCQYWIGENWFGMGEYSRAIPAFQSVIAHPISSKKAAAYTMMGASYEKLGDVGSARRSYEKVLQEYSDSELSRVARKKLKALTPSN